MTHFPLLTVTLLLPLAGALVIGVIPKEATRLIRAAALVSTLVTFVVSLFIVFHFNASVAGITSRSPIGVVAWASGEAAGPSSAREPASAAPPKATVTKNLRQNFRPFTGATRMAHGEPRARFARQPSDGTGGGRGPGSSRSAATSARTSATAASRSSPANSTSVAPDGSRKQSTPRVTGSPVASATANAYAAAWIR